CSSFIQKARRCLPQWTIRFWPKKISTDCSRIEPALSGAEPVLVSTGWSAPPMDGVLSAWIWDFQKRTSIPGLSKRQWKTRQAHCGLALAAADSVDIIPTDGSSGSPQPKGCLIIESPRYCKIVSDGYGSARQRASAG